MIKKIALITILASIIFSCNNNIVNNEKLEDNCDNCSLAKEKNEPQSVKAVVNFSSAIVKSYRQRKGLSIKAGTSIENLEKINISVLDSSGEIYNKELIPDELNKKASFSKLAVGTAQVSVTVIDSLGNTMAEETKDAEISAIEEKTLNMDLVLKVNKFGDLGVLITIREEGDPIPT